MKQNENKSEKAFKVPKEDIKPEKDVLSESGQIPFKGAMKKVVNTKPKKTIK